MFKCWPVSSRLLVSTFLLSTVLTLMPSGSREASAGARSIHAYCNQANDGSGYCYGTLRGFRDHPDPNAYFRIFRTPFFSNASEWGDGIERRMTASLNGRSYSCDFERQWGSTTANHATDYYYRNPMFLAADLLMSGEGYFRIEWNTGGYCVELTLAAGSQYLSD